MVPTHPANVIGNPSLWKICLTPRGISPGNLISFFGNLRLYPHPKANLCIINLSILYTTQPWLSEILGSVYMSLDWVRGSLHESGLSCNPDRSHSVCVETIRDWIIFVYMNASCNSIRIHVNKYTSIPYGHNRNGMSSIRIDVNTPLQSGSNSFRFCWNHWVTIHSGRVHSIFHSGSNTRPEMKCRFGIM